ncbi:ATP-binding protein [Granulicella arctica]|uniref:ATP-binding protein n=1 Tax=Granulicella arctica TaxID=940613 RepID=UPI0021DFAACF|nr:ATP-binding protein [Granulicella arctica]
MLESLINRSAAILGHVPRSRLFFKIFGWFWFTTIAIHVAFSVGSALTGVHVVPQGNMYATVAPLLAAEAVDTFETGGAPAFAQFSEHNFSQNQGTLFLLNGFYADVLSRTLPPNGVRIAKEARLGQLTVFGPHLAAYRYLSRSGRPYTLLLAMRDGPGQFREIWGLSALWFVAAIGTVVTMLCWWLTYHIVSPVHQIQAAARDVALGNLSARVAPAVHRRGDELAALARDFDGMVSRLESLIRSQKSLLNSVSHEVRSPLARITLAAEVLRDGPVSEAENALAHLDRDVSRLDILMGQLLTLSRLDTGLGYGERESLDLVQLVEEVAADGDFEARANGKRVLFRSGLTRLDLPANASALRSAVENVVRNGIRFSDTGAEVLVDLRVVNQSIAPCVQVRIRDHGPGVPDDYLDTICQPFFQIKNASISQVGNGLGLAIALEAVRMHRGSILATNLSPSGLEMMIEIPLTHASPSEHTVVGKSLTLS